MVVLHCQGYRNYWVVAKLGDIVPQLLWATSKSTYNYWWAHEVETPRHYGVRSGRTSEGFWGSRKPYRLYNNWLFLLVKVT